MSVLTLQLKEMPLGGLDLSPLIPSLLATKTTAQIQRLRLDHGGHSSSLSKLFEIGGEPGEHIRLLGMNGACHRIGQAMDSGLLEVHGEVGCELGQGMLGGELQLKGDAGDGVGLGMCGGLIKVQGNIGARAGGAIPGQTHGMNDGIIVISGNAGAQVGERMRRGLIVIGADCGSYVGDRMIAGTIVVLGSCGKYAGHGMRRGTVLLAQTPQRMPATFNRCGEFALGMLPLLATYVSHVDRRFGKQIGRINRATKWCGDMAYGGHGELLIADTV